MFALLVGTGTSVGQEAPPCTPTAVRRREDTCAVNARFLGASDKIARASRACAEALGQSGQLRHRGARICLNIMQPFYLTNPIQSPTLVLLPDLSTF